MSADYKVRPLRRRTPTVCVKVFNDLTEKFLCLLVKIANGDPSSQDCIIRMTCGHVGGSFSSKVVELDSSDAIENPVNDLLGSTRRDHKYEG